jgi:hypothetical protein
MSGLILIKEWAPFLKESIKNALTNCGIVMSQESVSNMSRTEITRLKNRFGLHLEPLHTYSTLITIDVINKEKFENQCKILGLKYFMS